MSFDNFQYETLYNEFSLEPFSQSPNFHNYTYSLKNIFFLYKK
jgi:hypothetical protein